jgi:AraC-like DNA-binding protein
MRDWEFVWLMQGDAQYCWGERAAAAPEGSVVLCRPGATDTFRWDPQRQTRHAFVHFQVGPLSQGWPVWGDWPLVREGAEDDILRPLFRHLLTWADCGDPEQCRLILMTMLTAFRTGQQAIGSPARAVLPAAVEAVCAFIAARLDEDPAATLPLPLLADHACVTPEYLCRLFKAALGHGPAEAVRRMRLERAAVLLARSNYTVAEAAALYGYASPFHFSRAFKQVRGHSPSEIRHRS